MPKILIGAQFDAIKYKSCLQICNHDVKQKKGQEIGKISCIRRGIIEEIVQGVGKSVKFRRKLR